MKALLPQVVRGILLIVHEYEIIRCFHLPSREETEIVFIKTLQPLLHLTLHTTRLSHICDIYYPCVTHKLCDTTLAYLGKIFVVWVRTGDVGIAALFFS